MKVVNIISGKDLGGPKQSFVDYGRMLSSLGFDVHYVLRPGAKCLDMLSSVPKSNIHIINYYRSDLPLIKSYSVKKLKALLDLIQPEIIFSHKQFDLMLLKLAYPSAYLVGIIHGFNSAKTEYADQLIAVSEAVTKWLKQKTPVPCQTIANTVEVGEVFRSAGNVSKKVVIGTMAVFRRKKQLDNLIKVASQMKDLDFKIIIAGRGFRKYWYFCLMHIYNVADVVEVRPWVKDKRVFFESIDIYCVSSKTESFNISLIEAMAHKVCVISSDCGGPLDIVDHENTGLLFKTGDVKQLELSLRKLIGDVDLRNHYGNNGFLKARQRFALPVITKKLADLIAKKKINQPKIAVFAGEVSGDMHAAKLIESLEVGYVFGMGGARMLNTGVNVVYGIDKFKIMGFLHVFLKLPMIIKRLSIIKQHLSVLRPDLVVLVDYPGFNMRVAKIAKQLDLKVLYYIAPKLWATREGRAKDLARDVDYLAVIFPFEVDYFKKFKIKAGYVGNPLLHLEDFVAGKLVSNQIAVLPGSRQSEVDYLLPVILESISLLRVSMPYLNFVLVQAEGVCLANFKLDGIEISTKSIEVMSESVLVLLASGTATLEAAILEKPMVVLYKTSWLNAIIARFLLKCKYISLPNILANKMLVSEFLQASCSAKNITTEVVKILKNKEYFLKIVKDLKQVKQELVSTNKQDISFVAKEMLNMK